MSTSVTGWTTTPKPLEEGQWQFPRMAALPDSDLVAIGGDLRPGTIVSAYCHGVFPMEVAEMPGALAWWSPNPRGIIPLDGLRVSKSMRQSAKRYEIRFDTRFTDVVRACADPSRPDGWITEEFIEAYTRLHEMGWAHSVEVFDRSGVLAGGLYGVRVAGLFAGESMFHRQRDASKVALMALVSRMRESGMRLLDVQWCTEHLASLGALAISRQEYARRLADAIGSAGMSRR